MTLAVADQAVAGRSRQQVAHVITESTPFGGAQRNTLLTLRGLVKDGYDAELACGPGGPLIAEARAVGVTVHVIPTLVREVDPVKDVRTLIALARLFRRERYRVVHTHSTKAGLLGRLAAWWARVPIIVHTIHGFPFEIKKDRKSRVYIALERLASSVTDRVVCVGEVLRQEVSGWKMAPEEKLTTIYSGIDFSCYVPKHATLDMKRLLGVEGAWPIVGSVGHLVEAKAQHYLIQAVAQLRARYPRIKLLLVGEGKRRPALEKQIDDLGVSAHVALLGERDDIADLLNVFDVYAMSSQREGVGRALTEAMYWGLPIVTTAVNGVGEVIVHEETGLLVPPHDPRALTAAIDRLVSDPLLAKRLGANARPKVSELMDGQRMIAALEELYQSLAEGKELVPGCLPHGRRDSTEVRSSAATTSVPRWGAKGS